MPDTLTKSVDDTEPAGVEPLDGGTVVVAGLSDVVDVLGADVVVVSGVVVVVSGVAVPGVADDEVATVVVVVQLSFRDGHLGEVRAEASTWPMANVATPSRPTAPAASRRRA